ncbi:MAG TPA: transglycosylase SLT domain-containing protein, partial [Acidimicrobiia bacterium]
MSLQQFMNALGQVESGNNYDAVGPYTGATYGHARGRWQIMEKIYPGWAREAGVDPNDMSPEAQDRVAAHKMQQYFNRYGSWELVAVAWFAGPGRADRAAREGVTSLKGIADVLGTDVPGYVSKVM